MRKEGRKWDFLLNVVRTGETEKKFEQSGTVRQESLRKTTTNQGQKVRQVDGLGPCPPPPNSSFNKKNHVKDTLIQTQSL